MKRQDSKQVNRTLVILLIIIFAALLVVFAINVSSVVSSALQTKESMQFYEVLRERVHLNPRPIEPEVETEKIEPEIYLSPIDFDFLYSVNKDAAAWIQIENTNIDFPVVQCANNNYYLPLAFDKTENENGTIYMDCGNAKDFTDANTIIYGHNMVSGEMFNSLSHYKDQSFFEDHPKIKIYTTTAEYTYEVFAAYTTEYISEAYTLNCDFGQYLSLVNERNILNTDTSVTTQDKILTLATCDYSFDNARMVVHGKLLEDGK